MTKAYGFYIVNSGEQANVYELDGAAKLIEGPRRLFLWRAKFERLRKYTASQTEYLIIKNRDGSVIHRPGPCLLFRNPVIHDSISTREAHKLDAHEVVVVYRHSSEAGERTVDRYLKYGPTIFIPAANEWLHKFSWHGMDPSNKTRYIAETNNFTKLKLIPDQFYYNVDEIRTADNGLVRVKLMIFYEIHDVEQMLVATADPIGDIISCLTADVTAFASSRSYLSFVENSCDLNEMSNYPHLNELCKGAGIRVTKIVFRGYFATPTIQANHDQAFDMRTNLELQFERETQQQQLLDQEQQAERSRIVSSHQLDMDGLKHSQKLEMSKLSSELQLELKRTTEKLERKKQESAVQLQMKKQCMDQKMEYYSKMKNLGVDLTQYIVNQAAIPQKITEISTKSGGKNAQVHFHMNNSGAQAAI